MELSYRVFSGQEHFVVKKEGMPIMAILSIAEYQELMKEHEELDRIREERVKNFQRIARRVGENVEKLGLTEEEFNDFIDVARQELHEEKQHDDASA
jgi:hypothetical protein